jgi:hypothetical protein
MRDDEAQSDSTSQLPNVEEVKGALTSSAAERADKEDEFLRISQNRAIQGERQYIHLSGLSDHYWHKQLWSFFIAGLMSFMILFQSFLLLMVGFGWWNFEKYTWLLPALLVQNLAQIVGLALFVVKALFKEMAPD